MSAVPPDPAAWEPPEAADDGLAPMRGIIFALAATLAFAGCAAVALL